MKKTLLLSFVIFATLASCQKAEERDDEQSTSGIRVFTATISEATKTTVDIEGDIGKIKWEAADEITIYDASENHAIYKVKDGSGTAAATFEIKDGQTPVGEGPYTAIYGTAPSPSVAQTYSTTASTAMYMSAEGETIDLKFTAECGIMKLKMTDATHCVSKVVVSDGTNEYTMNCSEAVAISSGTDFFIALPAATYTSVEVYASDNSVATKSPVSLIVQTGHIKPVNATNFNFVAQAPEPVVTYYNTSGIIENPELGTAFDYPGPANGNNNFKLVFSNANDNPINWAEGDQLEVKFDWADGNGWMSLFSIGDGGGWSQNTINAISSADTGNNKNKTQLTTSTNTAETRITPELLINAPSIWVRFSSNGYEYSNDGTNFTSYTLAADAISSIKSSGTTTPLYVGSYAGGPLAIHYHYLKVIHGGSTPADPINVTQVTLNAHSKTMYVGGADVQLSAEIDPYNADNKSVTWSSSAESVVTVSSTGLVHAVAQGNATVTVTTDDGDYTDTCEITVINDQDETITGNVIYYSKMGHKHNTPQPFDVSADSGYEIAIPAGTGVNDHINWAEGDTLEISFTCTEQNYKIAYIGDKTHINSGASNDPYYLYALYNGALGWWSMQANIANSYRPSVKSDDCDGKIRITASGIWYYGHDFSTGNLLPKGWYEAELTNGTGGLRPTFENILDLSTIYVMTKNGENSIAHINYIKVAKSAGFVPIDGITLSKSSTTIEVGESETISVASVSPGNATDKNVTWSSSNTSVATVSNGTITAVAAGEATITATAHDGSGITATCSVTVPTPTVWDLASFAVKTNPSKTTYTQGDALNLTGLVISATYQDHAGVKADKTVDLTSDKWTANPADGTTLSVTGEQTITFTSTEDANKTCQITVTVNEYIPPVGTFYLTADGSHSNIPVAFDVTESGYMINVPLSDLNISEGDELEIMFNHNGSSGEDRDRFLGIGESAQSFEGSWVFVEMYGGWFNVKNSKNKSFNGIGNSIGGVRISTANGIEWYNGSQWASVSNPDSGDSPSEAFDKLAALPGISIGSNRTPDNIETQFIKRNGRYTSITYIKITKASHSDAGLNSSGTGAISQGTQTGW